MRSLFVAGVLLLSGCPRVCENAQFRCEQNMVQICTSRGRWQTFADCKRVRTRDGKVSPGTCVEGGRCAPVVE